MSLATGLSTKDQKVLNAIFGSEDDAISHPHPKVIVDMSLPPDRNIQSIEKYVDQEKEAIEIVENNGDYIDALNIFDNIINEEPQYASAYNNRAQLRRLNGDESGALDDLKKAIELAQPPITQAEGEKIRVSKMQGTILSQTYSQLGGIYLKLAEQAKKDNRDYWEYEERASESLFYAGMFGNETARAVAVKINPYAKLCGNMVREALERECKVYQQEK